MKRHVWLFGLFSFALLLLMLLVFMQTAVAKAPDPPDVLVNEIQVNTAGTDWEFFEIRGAPAVDLTGLTLLVVEADDQSSAGNIDRAISLDGQGIPASGYWIGISPAGVTEYGVTGDLSIPDNTFENSTTSYILVAGFSGAVNDDLDTDNDGALDVTPWTDIVDAFTITDGGATDHAYVAPVLGPDGTNLPAGIYRCPDGPVGSFVEDAFLNFSTSDGTPGENNSALCGYPNVAINEIEVNTTSTDWEFFEIQGESGTDLSDLTLLVVEADDGTSAGNIDKAVDLTGQSIPDDGYWLGISPAGAAEYGVTGDLSIPDNTFENSTAGYLLVTGFSGAVNDDLDTDNDGSMDVFPWTAIVDGFTLWDSGAADHAYINPVLGPDGSNLPAGVYRCPNAPAGVFEQGVFLNFSTTDGTPGGSNLQCPNVEPPPFLAFDMVNSTSQNLITFIDDPAIPFSSSADGFTKYQRGVSASIPFAVLDDTASGFPSDSLGIIKGGNTEEFFGISDTFNDDTNGRDVKATWLFNIGGATDLGISIDMGAMGDFEPSDYFNMSYSFDGGVVNTAFQNSVDDAGIYTYTMESGSQFTLVDPMYLNGVLLTNDLQTISTVITGTGNVLSLTLTVNTDGGTEAMAFQNLVISGKGGTNVFPPTVINTFPSDGAEYVALNTNVEIEFSEAVTTTAGWYDFVCGAAQVTAASSGGPSVFTLDPVSDLSASTTCTVTVLSDQIASIGPPSIEMAEDYSFSFTTGEACGDPATYIYEVQGSGAASPIEGNTVSVEGVVVGDFQASDELNGFFVQEEDADADGNPATSDGVFVYEGSFPVPDVNVGDTVRVTGVVDEYKGLTQISTLASVTVCDVEPSSATPAAVVLPEAVDGDLESFEGMAVEIAQTMSVAQNYFLGRYGQLTLSSDLAHRLFEPTNQVLPNTPDSASLFDYNARNLLFLDDGRDSSACGDNPVPVPYLGAAPPDVLRGGDQVSGLVGVLDYGQINTEACYSSTTLIGRDYRLQPTAAPVFSNTNIRTAAPDDIGGTLKVAAFNVLNFFNGDGMGGGFPTSRGADTYNEFVRQRIKIFEALKAIDGDVVGVMEIENDGYDQYSAIAELAKIMNEGPCYDTDLCTDLGYTGTGLGAGIYDYVVAGSGLIGTDEIAVGLIYKTATVIPAADPVVVDEAAFVDPNSSGSDKNRPALIQTFSDDQGGIFTVIVNHLKSKGSECGPGDDDPEAGSCNVTRTLAAQYLVDTVVPAVQAATGDLDVMIIGDLNSYAKEDPIAAFEAGGFNNQAATYVGDYAYSYTFDGMVGTLDYALANDILAAQVTGATIWHINTDEPLVTDYDENYNPPGYFAPDAYRASDHDPVIVGLTLTPSEAGFTSNSPVVIGSLSIFTNTTANRSVIAYEWDFGDGSDIVTDTNPTHLYTFNDTFTVTLTAVGPAGTTTYSAQHVVLPLPPIASFTSNSPVVIGNLSVFTNTTTGGGILSYHWNFGDGTPLSTESNPTHTYGSTGEYTIILTATNEGGLSVASDLHIVVPEAPQAGFTSNSPIYIDETAVFTNTTTGAAPITYQWYFGDGSPVVTDTNPTHNYAAIGTYTVVLTATNLGGSDVVTSTIEVMERIPTSVSLSGISGEFEAGRWLWIVLAALIVVAFSSVVVRRRFQKERIS